LLSAIARMIYPRTVGIDDDDSNRLKSISTPFDGVQHLLTQDVILKKFVIGDYVPMLFLVISTGYMFPWTAICSKVHYYTQTFGQSYFVLMNILFYVSGLPIMLISRKFDTIIDIKYNSKRTYLIRTIFSLVCITTIIFFIPQSDGKGILICVGLLGIFTWALHGCQSKLAALVRGNSATYQQIGFVLPAVLSLILNSTLGSPREYDCLAYFCVIGAFLILSIIFAIKVLRNEFVMETLDNKDRVSSLLLGADIIDAMEEDNGNNSFNNEYDNNLNEEEQLKLIEQIKLEEINNFSLLEQFCNMFTCGYRKQIHTQTQTETREKIDDNDGDAVHIKLLGNNNSMDGIQYHVYSLFIVMFCSILEGSFISYVVPVNKDLEISTVLYFVRVFSDLIGRPMTMLNLPNSMRTIDFVFKMSCFRVLLLILFFLYIYLLKDYNLQSDALIVAFQFILSFTSGFLVVLIYESASQVHKDDGKREKSIELLTLTFQVSSVIACLFGVGILLITNNFTFEIND